MAPLVGKHDTAVDGGNDAVCPRCGIWWMQPGTWDRHRGSILTITIGVVIGGVGGIIFGVSRNTSTTLKDHDQNQPSIPAQTISSLYGQVQGQWIAGLTLVGIGGATAIVGVIVLGVEAARSSRPVPTIPSAKQSTGMLGMW